MTRKELASTIQEELSESGKGRTINRLEVECVLDAFGKVSAAELLGGGEITIQNVGKLKVRNTSARKGRNPRTGEEIEIPAGKKVIFAPGKEFREALK